MNVLVTGGAGFIGSHIIRLLLEDGHHVSVLDNLKNGHREDLDKRARLTIGDMTDPQKTYISLKNIDAVIHLAGLIVVPDSVKDPILYCQNNVLGTVNLLEQMRKADVRKIIFSSSACVYGTPDKFPIKEDAPIRPDNPYGAAKAAIEVFLRSYHVDFGFDVTILRYFNPYGPGEKHDPETHAIPNFIKATLAKAPIPLYWQGEQIRDFIFIKDLVRAHIDVLPLGGFNIFNVGTETGIKVKDVLDAIFEIIGYESPIEDLGERLGDVQVNYASSIKLHKTVNWSAKVNLKEGLQETINYYKDNL